MSDEQYTASYFWGSVFLVMAIVGLGTAFYADYKQSKCWAAGGRHYTDPRSNLCFRADGTLLIGWDQ